MTGNDEITQRTSAIKNSSELPATGPYQFLLRDLPIERKTLVEIIAADVPSNCIVSCKEYTDKVK